MTPWPLSIAFPLALLVSIGLILAFDTVASRIAAGDPSVQYGKLWPLQFGLYAVIGFCAMLAVLDIRLVELVGALTGFVEATLGWWISWRIGPGRVANATPSRIAIAIFSNTAFGFGFALLGALLFNIAARLLIRFHG